MAGKWQQEVRFCKCEKLLLNELWMSGKDVDINGVPSSLNH